MERVWQKVGQRPSRTEWEISNPKISYTTYKQRFGGWTDACLKFIEYKMGGKSTIDNLQTLCQDCNLGKSDEFIGVTKP